MSEPRAPYVTDTDPPPPKLWRCANCQHEYGYTTRRNNITVLVLVINGMKIATIEGYTVLHCRCGTDTPWHHGNTYPRLRLE